MPAGSYLQVINDMACGPGRASLALVDDGALLQDQVAVGHLSAKATFCSTMNMLVPRRSRSQASAPASRSITGAAGLR